MLFARFILALVLIGGPALHSTDVFAQDVDDILGGFDDEESGDDAEPDKGIDDPTDEPTERIWDLTGAINLASSYAYNADHPAPGQPDYRGLTRLQAELSLQLDLDLPGGWQSRIAGRGYRDYFYAVEGRSDFSNEVLDAHERENEFQEIWLRGALSENLDLKFGRQIVNWGRSDNLRVIDVLNPVDRREPGLVDIEDLRLPVTMTRLDYFFGAWQLTGVAVHETRFDTGSAPGSEFLPASSFFSIPERTPGNGGQDTEWALALTGIFSGWDMSLHWARFYDDRPHGVGPGFLPSGLEHSRISMYGISGQKVMGNVLWKTEVAFFDGLDFFEPSPKERGRLDAMIGMEYSGFDEGSVAIEIVNRRTTRFDSVLENALNQTRRNRVEASLRYSADFWNQSLHFTAIFLSFGAHAQDGAILRAQLTYDVRDALSVTGGILMYEEGEFPPMDQIPHKDRLFLSAKYSF